jgi:hypothetical protein
MDEVVAWLNGHASDMLRSYFHLRRVQVPLFSLSLSAKVNALAQLHCAIMRDQGRIIPGKIFLNSHLAKIQTGDASGDRNDRRI